MKKIYEILKDKIAKENILFDEPMSKHTTFKVGGNCDVFITPNSIEEIEYTISMCREYDEPFVVIGKGSNLLVGDKGIRGIVISICKNMNTIEDIFKEDNGTIKITAGAGIMLSRLANEVLANEATGFEFASGIPGTLGGAVAMNAGAYGGEIKDCIVSAKVLTKTGEIKDLEKDKLELGYRSSIIQNEDMIVLSATFNFEKGNVEEIKGKMNDFNGRRKDKQPLEYPSAGSTFKRPEGYFAGKLIMDSGLAGYGIGGACVSEKHCGFVINKDNATAKDILDTIHSVQNIVLEKQGVKLETEVKMLGEF